MSIPGSEAVEVPVLIVGAGPAGLALSVALSRYGVGHLVVERHRGTAHTPRAHIINQRTVEIFRHLGISDRFHAVATPQHLMANNLWVTTLAGLEVARSETWGTSAERAADYRAASPEPMANCPQTVLEPMLLAAARDMGADIRFGWEFTSLAQDQDGVTSVIRERDGEATLTVRSQYVVGADGARSRVLGQAGLTVEGPDDLARAANIWFRADLSRYLAYRPGVLTWNVMPGPLPPLRLGTLICHKPFTEFVLAFMYDPEQVSLDTLGADELHRRIRAFVGEDVDAEILGVAGWQVRAQIASSLCGRTRVLHGRRGSPASADQRPRAQHVHRGRVQPRLEAGPGPGRAGGRRAAGQLLPGTAAGRGAGRPARHHQPAGRRRGRGCPRVRAGPARRGGLESTRHLVRTRARRGRAQGRAAQGDRAEQLPVQRPWHRARVPLSKRRHRRRRQPGPRPRRATPSCTTSRPPAPAPASRTPGSNRTASRSPRSTSSTTWASPCSPGWAARHGYRRRRKSPRARGFPFGSMSSEAGKA